MVSTEFDENDELGLSEESENSNAYREDLLNSNMSGLSQE